jgi:predicted PurR-regulated permease PerM
MSNSSNSSALARLPVMIAAIVIALAGMAWLSPVLTPLMLGIFFSALAAPAFYWLVRRKVPRWLALVILIALLGALLLGLALLIATAIRQLTAGLQTYQTQMQAHLQALQGTLSNINFAALADTVQPAQQSTQATNWVLQFLHTVAEVVGGAVFALLVVAFLLLESQHFEARFRAGLGENHPLRLRLNSFGISMIRYVVARTKHK